MNGMLLLVIAALGVFVGAAAYDPRFARRLASVLCARAEAVEAGRSAYKWARKAQIKLLDSGPETPMQGERTGGKLIR